MPHRPALPYAWKLVCSRLPLGVWILDPQGTVLDANPALCRWLESKDLAGTKADEWLVEPGAWRSEGETEFELRSRSGVIQSVDVSGGQLRDEDGSLIGYAHTFTNESTTRALESRLVGEVQRMARLAGEDPVTGLANRRAFDEALRHLVEEHSRRFGVIVVDVDDFKAVNDTCGHLVGDDVLRQFGVSLKQLLRDGDLIARIGGDEFAVLLPNVTKMALSDAAERVRDHLFVRLCVEGREMVVYASTGYAHSGDGPADVLRRADRWMYQHKTQRESGGLAALVAEEEKIKRQGATG